MREKLPIALILLIVIMLALRLFSIGNYSLKKARAHGEIIELSPQAQVEREIAKELKNRR